MKIFVTGGTGVLGRNTIRLLINAGHNVVALSRGPSNDSALASLGANPVTADLYDANSLLEHVQECEAILHLATKIPKTKDMNKPESWAENDRIREHGTKALVDAALKCNSVKSVIYPSVNFMYSDRGENWQSATTAELAPLHMLKTTLIAEKCVERFSASDSDRNGASLRFGSFYGAESRDSQDMLHLARRGLVMPLAPSGAYKSMIWIEDAASAIVAALDHKLSGVFDVTESEPCTQDEAIKAMANAVGRKRLFKLPSLILRLIVAREIRDMLSRSQRVSSARFEDLTGWKPAVPNQTIGWRLLATTN